MLGFINKDQSLSGILTINDGNGTKISKGIVECKTLSSKNSIITNNNACNNSLVGGILSVGSNITCGNLKTRTLTVLEDVVINGTIQYKQKTGCLINLPSFQVPIQKSIFNTSQCYSNLNLQSYLGLTGNNVTVFLYPHYKLIFYADNGNYDLTLQEIDNSNNDDILFQTILFNSTTFLCTKIYLLYDGEIIK